MTDRRAKVARGEPLHLQVARKIRNDIEAGVLRDGEVLPSTRELAREWSVSVFTISEAMKALAAEGLVESSARSKRVVRSPEPNQRDWLAPSEPRAVLIGGYAGSGKTELGRIIARTTGWAILDKDTITRPVVEAALETLGCSPHDRESETYLTLVRPREYEALTAAIVENLECGVSTVATAPYVAEFADAAWIERTTAAFDARGASTHLVWIRCDAPTMHAYIRHRGAARDARKIEDWPAYLASINVEFRPAGPHHVVDNSATCPPLQAQARELLTAIRQEAKAP